MATNPSERREFFRVDDDVIFDVLPVDTETAQQGNPSDIGDGPAWQVLEALALIDQKTQQATAALGLENRNVAQSLTLLNSKIDLIARHTVFSHFQHLTKTRISLCEDGIAFKSSRMLYKGSFVQLRIIFLPRFVPIIAFAQIIRCESRENSYNVAAKFFRLEPSQQQLIAQTLIKAQQQS